MKAFILIILFAAIPQMTFAQQRPAGWHVADYPARNKMNWRMLSREYQSSFPRGGSPVQVEPFAQDDRTIYLLKDLKLSKPLGILRADAGSVIIDTADGAFQFKDGEAVSLSVEPSEKRVQIGEMTYKLEGSRLLHGRGDDLDPVLEYGKNGLPDSDVRDLKMSPDGTLYVATASGIGILEPAGGWKHLTGREGGLPVNDATSLSFAPDGTLWVGTAVGAARRSSEGHWSYRMGPRWMVGDQVLAVEALENGGAWILTRDSLTRIFTRRLTLREKAKIYDQITQERHVRHGAVTGCNFRKPGDLDSWFMGDNDNDGLWTSMYLGGKCFEYAVTKDPEAKRLAKVHFDFLERLETINGMNGYLSRSLRPMTFEPGSHESYGYKGLGEWHESTVEPGWQWKSDTSSDELVGHYFAWALYYDLVAKGDPKEEERVRRLVRSVTNNLVDHDYMLLDVDGIATRWAVYSPRLLNGDLLWIDEIGLHSLCILSHLKVAIHITDDPKFKEAYRALIDKSDYNLKQIFAKEMVPNNPYAGQNHSDSEMAWLAYYPLLLYPEEDENLRYNFQYSAVRSMRIDVPERSPFFNFVFAVGFPQWAHVADGIESLKEWPLDLRTFRVRNSHRDDVVLNPVLNRHGRQKLLEPVGFDERCPQKWNHDPYAADEGDDQGYGEEDGAAWLLPYWMGVYHGLIVERDS